MPSTRYESTLRPPIRRPDLRGVMAYLRFGEEFTDEDLVALFECIERADIETGYHAPEDLTRELISVMQARAIGDREELASMLLELDDRARPSRPKPFRPGTMLNPHFPRVTVNFDV
jgi:hypothetical protein